MNIKELSNIALKILIHKNMAQSAAAIERGDEKSRAAHDRTAKIISDELARRKNNN